MSESATGEAEIQSTNTAAPQPESRSQHVGLKSVTQQKYLTSIATPDAR